MQETARDVVVRLVTAPGYTQASGAAIVRELRARLGPAMQISIEEVAAIPRTSAGKFRAVINSHAQQGGMLPGEP